MGTPDDIDIDVDREAVASFLKKKSSMELLIAVSEDGAQYTEIYEQTRIAESTLSIRLRQGVEVGVIEDESRRVDGDREDVYVLTPLGLSIRRRMHKARMGEVFWRLMELRNQFDESKKDVMGYIENDSLLEAQAKQFWKQTDGRDEPRDQRDYFWEAGY